MLRLPRLAVLLAFVALPLAALARSPEETLVAYVRAIQKDGLTASVPFTHPEELATFRAELEPELARRVKSNRTRQQFIMFADPYNQKQLRPFKDDADFATVFIKWMGVSGMVGVTTYENVTVEPLGYVVENDLRHVVARFTHQTGDQTGERVTVTTMKMMDAQPMVLLPQEMKQLIEMVRKLR